MFEKIALKNRIALYYSFAFSVILLLICSAIYFTVYRGINQTMNETLNEEIEHHVTFVAQQDTFREFVEPREWEEIEHTDLALNPVFIAIYDAHFRLVEKSPNLFQNQIPWNKKKKENTPYSTKINSFDLLISQAKLIHHGEIVGYVVIGVSPKHNELALDYLRLVLLILFPVSVLIIFISARWIAAKAIRPVFDIIDTAQSISESTLSERIPLPTRKDELYQLAKTINSLLDRLEYQIIKAKQFSADASHELRTPLAIIKGTLGILIRRERTQEEYQEKINYSLKQVDRLDVLVEQFLLLSRVENNSLQLKKTNFDLKEEVLHTLERFDLLLHEKQITTNINQLHSFTTENYREFIEIILDNILSNAIKYTSPKGQITISSKQEGNTYFLTIKDNGIGMKAEDVLRIEKRHFRSDDVENETFSGVGLGLNIAKKLADLAEIDWTIKSVKEIGTEIQLKFNKK